MNNTAYLTHVQSLFLEKGDPETALGQMRYLRNQFDFDSVDFMNFAVALQTHLKVEIPEEDYPQLATLNGCIAYLKLKCNS